MTDYFQEKICNYCKNECKKAIVFEKSSDTVALKCVNYMKDESKIKGYEKPIERTAKYQRCIMPKLLGNYE